MPPEAEELEEGVVVWDDEAIRDKCCVGRDEEMDKEGGVSGYGFLGEDRVVCVKLGVVGEVRGLGLISSRMANHRERDPARDIVSGSKGWVI